jgi:hypothetical protein
MRAYIKDSYAPYRSHRTVATEKIILRERVKHQIARRHKDTTRRGRTINVSISV